MNPAKGLAPIPGFTGVAIQGGTTAAAELGAAGAGGGISAGALNGDIACAGGATGGRASGAKGECSGAAGPGVGLVGANGEPPAQSGLEGVCGAAAGANGDESTELAGVAKSNGTGRTASGRAGAKGEGVAGSSGAEAGGGAAGYVGGGAAGAPNENGLLPPKGPGADAGVGAGAGTGAGAGAPKAMAEKVAAEEGAKGLGTPGARLPWPASGPGLGWARPNGEDIAAGLCSGLGGGSPAAGPNPKGEGWKRVVESEGSPAGGSAWTKGEKRLVGAPPPNPGTVAGEATAKGDAPAPGNAAAGFPFTGISEAILCGGMGTVRLSSGEIGV